MSEQLRHDLRMKLWWLQCLTLRTGVDFQSGTVGMIQYVVSNIPLQALYDCCESVVSQQPAPISGGRHCRWTSKMRV